MKDQLSFYRQKLNYEIDPSDLFVSLNNDEKIIAVDSRSKAAFEEEHIPGALNLPYREMTIESTKDLQKDFLYVIYCVGIGCNASTKGALKMTELGFNVKELIGGIECWIKDGYETQGKFPHTGDKVSCAC